MQNIRQSDLMLGKISQEISMRSPNQKICTQDGGYLPQVLLNLLQLHVGAHLDNSNSDQLKKRLIKYFFKCNEILVSSLPLH